MKYQIWSFSYLADKNGVNVINGTKQEADDEFEIPCFNGFSFFKANGKFYLIHYPKIQFLRNSQKEEICFYCGYEPNAGEYGVIAGALGMVTECSESVYNDYVACYPIKQKDKKRLGY